MMNIEFVDRRGTNCAKWDGQRAAFGRDGLSGMWVADMDCKTAPCVQAALRAAVDHGAFGYGASQKGFVEAFAAWERVRHGYEVQPDWVRFSPGVVPAVNWLIQLVTAPGDAVLVNTPVYYPFFDAVKNNGRVLVTSELIRVDGVYRIDFSDFERQIAERRVKAFILCSPHNPVGRVWTRDELSRLLEICRRHGVFVISDEIHHDFTFDGARHIPAATLGDHDDMLVTLTAPTKTFNLAGLQSSVVIIPNAALRARFDTFVRALGLQPGNTLGFIAGEAAYLNGGEWLEALRAVIYQNYELARLILLSALPSLYISPLQGTYLMWLDFSTYLAPEHMADYFEAQCGLALDYGEWFGGGARCCVRLNLAAPPKLVEDAARRIAKNMSRPY